MAELDIRDYSRQVIDRYQQQAGQVDPATAKAATIALAASVAGEQTRASPSDAAKVARTAIETFEKQAKDGVPLDKARENVARTMGEQFDGRGKEVQRRERDQSLGLGM
jgi:hypothetical protein